MFIDKVESSFKNEQKVYPRDNIIIPIHFVKIQQNKDVKEKTLEFFFKHQWSNE